MKDKIINNTEIEKNCYYCENASHTHDDNYVLCKNKGIVNADYKCSKFIYDPLKRKPRKAILDIDNFKMIEID